jgi:winged helix DNA-binding protein
MDGCFYAPFDARLGSLCQVNRTLHAAVQCVDAVASQRRMRCIRHHKLVQSGFIKREEDPHDRRAKLLNLTDKGKELIQQGIEERYRWVDELAERLTVEERIQVSEALNVMTRAARELEAEPVPQVA